MFRPIRLAVALVVAGGALVPWYGARAAVIDLREYITATHGAGGDNTLIHHYTFEGHTLAERLQDRAGNADLSVVAYGTGSTNVGAANSISFTGPAFDGTTTTLTPYNSGGGHTHGGAGLSTVSNISLPATLTVEALLRPLDAPRDHGYAINTRAAGDNRGVFFMQWDGTNNLTTNIGDSFTQADNVRDILTPYTPGNWYYVANTYSVSGGNTTINSYVADMTAGGPLVHVHENVVASGHYGSVAPLGVGVGDFRIPFPGDPVQRAFVGQLDEVSLYNTVLSKSTLEAHLQALYIPVATGLIDWRAGLVNPSFEDPVLPDSGSGRDACNYDPALPAGWAGGFTRASGSGDSLRHYRPGGSTGSGLKSNGGYFWDPTDGDQGAAIILRTTGGITAGWFFQSLGIADEDDIGKVYVAGIDSSVREETTPRAFDGERRISFRTGVTGGPNGDFGEMVSLGLDTAFRSAASDDPWHTLTDKFIVDPSHVGEEIFLVFSVHDPSPWGSSDQYQFDNVWIVPEPGAWLLLVSALACGLLVRRRRR